MKASSLPSLILAATLIAGSSWASLASAQDTLIRKSGQKTEGKITGVKGGKVRIQIGSGATTIPLADIRKITMMAPPTFDAAAAELASGNVQTAVTLLQKLNDNFAGLPVPWAERAAAMLGDAKLEAGDAAGAKAAYAKFSEIYPEADALADLGRARLAVEAGQYQEASQLLQSILSKSSQIAFPDANQGPKFCQAYYLQGRVLEATDDNQAALQHYLTASAVFPFDPQAVASAEERARQLRRQDTELVAP